MVRGGHGGLVKKRAEFPLFSGMVGGGGPRAGKKRAEFSVFYGILPSTLAGWRRCLGERKHTHTHTHTHITYKNTKRHNIKVDPVIFHGRRVFLLKRGGLLIGIF